MCMDEADQFILKKYVFSRNMSLGRDSLILGFGTQNHKIGHNSSLPQLIYEGFFNAYDIYPNEEI